MDLFVVLDHLKKKIAEREKDIENTLATGGASSFDDYKSMVGELRGLSFAILEIRSLLNNLEKVQND